MAAARHRTRQIRREMVSALELSQMKKEPHTRYETSDHQPAGETPELEAAYGRPSLGKKITDDVSLLLETDAAKRRLAHLLESDTLGRSDQPSKAIAALDEAGQTGKPRNKIATRMQEYGCPHRPAGDRTRTTTSVTESGQIRKDLTVSSLVFTLVFVGAILAANTDQPIFWLLIGPAPVAVLHTIMTLLRQRLRRREGLLEFYERHR